MDLLCFLCLVFAMPLCASVYLLIHVRLKLDLDYVFFFLSLLFYLTFCCSGDGAADSAHILFSLSFNVKPD